jgi:hypothetical protein
LSISALPLHLCCCSLLFRFRVLRHRVSLLIAVAHHRCSLRLSYSVVLFPVLSRRVSILFPVDRHRSPLRRSCSLLLLPILSRQPCFLLFAVTTACCPLRLCCSVLLFARSQSPPISLIFVLLLTAIVVESVGEQKQAVERRATAKVQQPTAQRDAQNVDERTTTASAASNRTNGKDGGGEQKQTVECRSGDD